MLMQQTTPSRPDETAPRDLAEPDLLRLASYNVHGCVGLDFRRDVHRVASVIRELACDTVGLQEVGSRSDARAGVRQLDLLERETAMQAVAGATIVRGDLHYGNALLTRRRILGVRRHDLSFRRSEPRGALDVDIEVGRTPVRVVVTHLGLSAAERRHQVGQLIEILSELPAEAPLVILGDFNEWLPGGRALRWIHRLMEESPGRRSFPTWMPVFKLDRVWSRPRGSLLAFDVHRTQLARTASDHYPVKAVIAPLGSPQAANAEMEVGGVWSSKRHVTRC
jgi:endonuclease/exonuclease/phosphatase family metal-dependent hydrolase